MTKEVVQSRKGCGHKSMSFGLKRTLITTKDLWVPREFKLCQLMFDNGVIEPLGWSVARQWQIVKFAFHISYLSPIACRLLRKHFECLHLSRLVKLFVALWQLAIFCISRCVSWLYVCLHQMATRINWGEVRRCQSSKSATQRDLCPLPLALWPCGYSGIQRCQNIFSRLTCVTLRGEWRLTA